MVKLLMFAARNPHFLRDLRELRVKKTCRPYGGLVNYAEHDFTGSINSNRMIFLAHPRDLTPIESHSSKNRGRGAAGSETCKCATRTNARNLNPLIGLHHNFWTPRGGGQRAAELGCISIFVFRFLTLSRPPVQCHWPAHRVHHRRTRSA